jgi:hypothetical protein
VREKALLVSLIFEKFRNTVEHYYIYKQQQQQQQQQHSFSGADDTK